MLLAFKIKESSKGRQKVSHKVTSAYKDSQVLVMRNFLKRCVTLTSAQNQSERLGEMPPHLTDPKCIGSRT